VREAADRVTSQNNLKQLAIAMHAYQSDFNRLPPAVVYDAQGKPLYSWRVLILPYLEQNNLYQQFHLDEPWDSENNKLVLASMPKLFAPSPGITTKEPNSTFYQVLDSPVPDARGAAFHSGLGILSSKPKQFPLIPCQIVGRPGLMESPFVSRIPASFPDDTSNTILIAEAAEAVPWTKPGDLTYNPDGDLPRFGGFLFKDGFNVAMADGSVHFVSYKVSPQTLRAAITAAAGDMLGDDW
jgi:prepilin-type processing-associated H-X9-DG protein